MKEEREAPSTVASAAGTASPASGAASASGASRSSKAPDSACSVGNSQSQRSGSSKSRISNSSGSSGYGGHPSTLSSANDMFPQPRSKDKDHRKKKLKAEQATPDAAGATSASASASAVEASGAASASLPHKKSDAAPALQAAASPAGVAAFSAPELAEEAASAAEADAQASGAASAAAGPGDCVAAPASPSAAFSQSLSCPSSSRSSSNSNAGAVEAEVEASPEQQEEGGARGRGLQQGQPQPQLQPQQPTSDNKDEFTVVVSMQDGAVIYTSPSITQALSFPRDMWVGKSFIDYVHPDDRLALIQHITTGVALPRRKGGSGESPAKVQAQAPLFCRLRRYPSLRDGFAVAERRLLHRPFSLQLSFYELPASASGGAPAALAPGVLLTVTATAVCSAYSRPNEKPVGSSRFATRHQADGKLTHVDGEAVSLLGYLPQQLLGRSVFDVYHPADLRGLQHVYRQLVSRDCESPLRGQPCRLRTHNGCYVRVHTEWSSFVNPWTRRLEFVVGQHHVVQGPSWPDVFAEVQDEEMFGEELLQDSKAAQKEILQLLQEEVRRGEPGTDRRDVSRRCKDLASFMETLIGEIGKPELRVDPAATAATDGKGASFSERSSVTLGEISPHHDYYDSKSSSETPPSYNQLNYDDNIQRFFESKPKTIPSDDSGERLMALEPTSRSTDEDTKAAAATNVCRATRNCLSPVNDTGSGSNSGSGTGSASTSANTAEADGNYKPPQLTEALLSRHNEDMEKRMVQRHREQRSKGGEGKCKKPHHCHPPALADKAQVESAVPSTVAAQVSAPVGVAAHGTKRSGSHSWDGEPLKASKHSHAPSPPAAPPPPAPPRDEAPPPAAAPGPPPMHSPATAAKDAGLSLWPPFSVAVTPLHSPQACTARGNFCTGGCSHAHASPQILPLYYLPAPTSAPSGTTPAGSGSRSHQQAHAPAAFLQQQGGALPYLAAGLLYQAAPLLYPLAPPPPPPPSHLLALHQPLLHHHQQQHHHHQQQQHPSTYQLATAARGGVSLPEPACQQSSASHHQHQQYRHQPLPPLPRPASCATSVKVEPGSSAASVAASVLNRGLSDGSQKCCRTSGEEETEAEDSGSGSGQRGRGQSSSSYTYSFLRSDGDSRLDADAAASGAEDMLWERMENGSLEGTSKRRPILKDPPWLENVEVTPDLMFRYQVSKRELDTVLKDDLQKLHTISQPMLVNEQLGQLYLDMACGGTKELCLDEGELTSSSCGSGNDSAGAEAGAAPHKTRKKRRSLEYSKLVMIFEENAPMPSPVSQPA